MLLSRPGGGSASLAGAVGTLASQPGDTLLSQVNDRDACAVDDYDGDGGDEGGPTTAAVADPAAPPAAELLRMAVELGPSGLYRGTIARLLHATSIVVIQLLANDKIRSLCGLVEMGTVGAVDR